MKKMIRISFIYFILAMACGVFYREFTKYNGFSGRTALAFTHLHLMALGSLLFLIVALFFHVLSLEASKKFHIFLVVYNIGLPFMAVMLFLRGIFQVLGTPLSKGADAAISGMAGISHITVTAGLIFLFLALTECAGKKEK